MSQTFEPTMELSPMIVSPPRLAALGLAMTGHSTLLAVESPSRLPLRLVVTPPRARRLLKSVGGNDRSFQRSSALDSHRTDGPGDSIFLHGVEITAIHRRQKFESLGRIDQGLVWPGWIAR